MVDDASSDPEIGHLSRVAGIGLIHNPQNMGFVRTCNAAATGAAGRYLFFVNNDTELRPGAVDALADLLEARRDAGIAGAKLIYPDERLQEAGGIIWNDGSGWNYGRGDDPGKPEYCYVREVDYCSGAAILVRRSLFEELGGFDESFAPAYYEDTDLAFRVRARGLKVLFEPRSVVIHHEGVSNGTDLASGVKAYQVTNRERMLARWRDVLRRDHYPPGTNVLRARERARHRRVILVADHYVPEPDRDAGSRSTLGILSNLVASGWVVKFWPHNRLYSPIYTPLLEAMGVEVIDHRWGAHFEHWLRSFGADLDHLLLMRPKVALDLLPTVKNNAQVVLSFYGHDLHFARMHREAVIKDDNAAALEAEAMERLERSLWRNFNVVLYPSEQEAAHVRALEPGVNARAIVPFCFERFLKRTAPPSGSTVLFVAGFAHPPNVDAAEFLVRAVFPILTARRPDVRLVLAGSNPTQVVRALASDTVKVTGYVSDAELSRLYATSRVAVVPLRFGAGVKGKVAEALSEGVPLVTTPVGAEGIPGLERVAVVRDDAAGIAEALVALLGDDGAWVAQSAAQAGFAEQHFSRETMRASLIAALEAGERAKRPPLPAIRAA
ncbi:MAG: glycosyltransferase [Acetobacteraceae bacterium]|nr:glycosyltransferase [Acetobacteraceae bacterium]